VVFRGLAIAPARPRNFPALVFLEAIFAGTAARPIGMVMCILVEWDSVGRVEVAEYVAAPTAVMAAGKV